MKAIIDIVGRFVVGKVKSEDDKNLTLINPVIIHTQPNPESGELMVQAIPYAFMEFIDKTARDSNVWTFDKSSIIVSDIKLDKRITTAAESINVAAKPEQPPQQDEDNVVKLYTGKEKD